MPADCISLLNRPLPSLPERNSTDNSTGTRAVLLTHCGRKKNRKREVTVTISHLLAIRRAIYDKTNTGPYALILEDDLQFAFEVDFAALIASAPSDFGVLQLVTSNDYSVLNLWRVYLRHNTTWVKRKENDDYWCAGAYIINKALLKPYIDRIIAPIEGPSTTVGNSWVGVHLIAGYERPVCTPSMCCENNKQFNLTNPPCVRSPRGYASDNFIYSIIYGNSYMLTVPIVTGGVFGNRSTLHQDHVSFHVSAFNRINTLVNEMKDGTSPLPSFLNKNCMFNRTA